MYVELRRCTGRQDGPEDTTPNSNVAGECAISVIPLKAWATSAALNRFDLLEQQGKGSVYQAASAADQHNSTAVGLKPAGLTGRESLSKVGKAPSGAANT